VHAFSCPTCCGLIHTSHTQGTETGKLLIFNAFTHELEREVKEHGGGINCMLSNNMGNVLTLLAMLRLEADVWPF
jgi:hypothetical protein